MRRLGGLILALALAVPLVGLALIRHGGPAVAHAALPLLELLAPAAAAEATTMTFESVPSESAAALEARTKVIRNPHVKVTVTTEEPGEEDSVGAAGQVVRSGDMTRLGDDIHIQRNEVVHGDVVTVFGGDVIVDGTVHGDVAAAMGGDVYLNATARVDGDVICVGGELHQEPGAYVSGKCETRSWGGRDLGKGRRARDWERELDGYGLWGGLRLIKAFVRFLLIIGLTLLVAWVFQRRVAVGAETMRRQPAMSLGLGALVLVLAFPSAVALAVVSVLLVITIIGIPLAVVAALGYALFYAVFAVFGLTIGAVVAGQWLAGRSAASPAPVWKSALLGVMLLAGAGFVGRLLEVVGVFGFHALGVAVVALAGLTAFVLGTIGGGAWLKWEFSEGLFGQWWGRWQARNGRTLAPAPGAAAPPAPPPPPTAAGSPPETFRSPDAEPPGSGPAAGA